MSIVLNNIPGFSDLADSNFAGEQFALGINFARALDNATFGMVRPEVFVGRYINGDTVTLPTSPIDGYTYEREELSYAYSFSLTGGTSTSSNGAPSLPGAVRYLAAEVNQVTGLVSTYVEYLVGNGSGAAISNDGTLTVFTFATRRLTSLVVAATPAYVPVSDTEIATDDAVTDSIMQRINHNAKFAALNTEIVYMGEFTNGETCPRAVSPADGYEYQYSEMTMRSFWRWTTQGDSLVDMTDANYKQVDNIYTSVTAGTGLVNVEVDFYHSGLYPTNYGRVIVVAFCKRNMTPVSGSSSTQGISGLGDGVVDFVDITTDLLSSGHAVREDVLERMVQNIRYAICRTEFFEGNYTHGAYVSLPVSPIDGYKYSREELTYVFGYSGTGPGSDPRFYDWNANVDQGSGLVTSIIIRCPNGGAGVTTNDGHLEVTVIARRDHVSNQSDSYIYGGGGTGANDVTALQNGGFDQWFSALDQAAQEWVINQQTGAGYGAQSAGLVSPFSQRLGIGASATAQTAPGTYPPTHNASVLSSSISVTPGTPYFLSWAQQPSAAGVARLTVNVYMYSAVGDCLYFTLQNNASTIAAGLSQASYWFTIPKEGDTTINTNASSGSVPILTPALPGAALNTTPTALDFIPTSIRIEFYYDGALSSYIDLDETTFINQLDPSIGQIAQRGSNSLAFFPAISFEVTNTTFTPDLTFDILRADGTTTHVTGGSGTSVTGLAASTDYSWYPYLDESTGLPQSVQTGGSGTPPWLQLTPSRALYAAWYGIANLPFAAAPIDVTTLATPSGGGSAPPSGGSGGGDDGCLEHSMLVHEMARGIIAAHSVKVGDFLASIGGSFLQVEACEMKPHHDWIELEFSHGGKLTVTSGHPFQTIDGTVVRAWALTVMDLLTWTEGVCSPVSIRVVKRPNWKMKITLSSPHVFFAGATADRMTLTHNFQPAPIQTL
jgi:hypothetical protein